MKILNWTFGACFRTIGRFLAIFIVGVLLIFIGSKLGFNFDFILPIKVDALTTITPNDYGHKVEYVEYLTQLQQTVQSDWVKGDLTNFCTGRCYLTKDWYYVKLNQSLNPGITYTWNFNTWVTNRDNQNYYNKSNFYMIASNTGKYEGSSSANVTNLTCRAGIEEGSTSKVSWSCSFTPTTQINYLYLRISFSEDTNKLFTSYGCNKGTLLNDNAQIDAINNQTGVIKDQTDKINDTLNNDNVDESLTEADSFFNDFTTNTHGLTGIITAPLNAIQSLTSKTCSPLVLPLPFVDKDLTLPCMREIYVDNFGAFMNLYDVITLGIISYWVMVRIFALVKDFKNPDHDEIEVMDL